MKPVPQVDFVGTLFGYVGYGVLFVILLAIVLSCLFIVHQQQPKIIERFGRFLRVAHPGLNIKVPFVDRIAAVLTLQTQNVTIPVVTQTKDNVFVTIKVAIQYRVKEGKEMDSYYQLKDPITSIKQYVVGVVLSTVRDIDLDGVFSNKQKIADQVKSELTSAMTTFGYEIVETLVNEIEPDQRVVDSMNAINAALRMKQAAEAEGDAAKIKLVKAAEAEKESKKLQGEGVAEQRKAIAKGLEESVSAFNNIDGLNAAEVMKVLLMTTYFDTIRGISKDAKSNVILIPHQPGGMTEIGNQILTAMLTEKASEK